MAGFTAALTAASIGMQMYGQVRAGQDAQAAANYNAAVYEQQASIIDVRKGLTAEQYDRMIKKLKGSTVSAIASSGYDFSGSFLDVYNDSLTQAFLDKEVELYNLEVSKSQAGSAAAESRRTGEAMRTSANIGALSTLLTEGNDWYSKYGGFGQTTSGTKAPSKLKSGSTRYIG